MRFDTVWETEPVSTSLSATIIFYPVTIELNNVELIGE